MKSMFTKMMTILRYVIHREGFFTKKIIISIMILVLMLIVDIVCSIWSKMSVVLLGLLVCNLITRVMIRYVELKRYDKDNEAFDISPMHDISEQQVNNTSIDSTVEAK